MTIDFATADDLTDITQNMRHRDLLEMEAQCPVDGRIDVAAWLVERWTPFLHAAVCAKLAGRPVAIGFAAWSIPGVANVGLVATGQFNRIAVELTRFVKHEFFPGLVKQGAHRIETVSMAGHEEAHRWLRILGLREEAVLQARGKRGENFHLFAKVDETCLRA